MLWLRLKFPAQALSAYACEYVRYGSWQEKCDHYGVREREEVKIHHSSAQRNFESGLVSKVMKVHGVEAVEKELFKLFH